MHDFDDDLIDSRARSSNPSMPDIRRSQRITSSAFKAVSAKAPWPLRASGDRGTECLQHELERLAAVGVVVDDEDADAGEGQRRCHGDTICRDDPRCQPSGRLSLTRRDRLTRSILSIFLH
jgi:hypothetical protein